MREVLRKSGNIAVRNHIEKEVIKNGIIWSVVSLIALNITVWYYLSISEDVHRDAYLCFVFGILSLIASPIVLGFHFKNVATIKNWFFRAAALFIGLSWSMLALTILLAWGSEQGADKVIIIAFMISIITWYIDKISLVFSTVPVICVYGLLALYSSNLSTADIIVSLLKFPILFGAFVFTIGKLISRTRDVFGESADMIQALEESSEVDELTQVKNRKGFNRSIKYAIAGSRRYEIPVALVAIDIDYFKQYNDMFGHIDGDKCLKAIAQIFNDHAKRASDTVARVGGEEFALILPGLTLEKAEEFCKTVCNAINDRNIPHPKSYVSDRVTISVGVTMYNGFDNEAEFYKKADTAMYLSKTLGRNTISVSTT